MSLARGKVEAEQQAGSLSKELESVKVSSGFADHPPVAPQVEVTSLLRLAKQERDKGRQATREREEEGQLLRRVQARLQVPGRHGGNEPFQELKATLGGRVKQLEADLGRCEAAREALREKKEGEVRQVGRLLGP